MIQNMSKPRRASIDSSRPVGAPAGAWVVSSIVEAVPRSFGHVGARPDQGVESVHRLPRRPGNAAQQYHPVERVVEGPRVVTGDRHEDATPAGLDRPEQGPRLLLLDLRGQDAL